MSFFHGVKIERVSDGFVTIPVTTASVIGLIGIAPQGPINEPILVQSKQAAAQFGLQVPGFGIPKALNAFFQNGASTFIVVNVFNPDTMTATEEDEEQEVVNGQYQLDFAPIGNAIVVTNMAGDTTYVDGTHYTFDAFGLVTIIDRVTIPDGTDLKTTYDRLDATLVTSAAVIGEVDSANNRTGLEAFDNAYNLFGFRPRIFTSWNYSEVPVISAAMIAKAAEMNGFAMVDADPDTTLSQAIAGRATAGIGFDTASQDAALCYPAGRAKNTKTDAVETVPFGPFLAAVWARTIANEGFWVSPSNKAVSGLVGLAQPISYDPFSDTTDANTLNAAGIVTAVTAFGQGIKTWGNRNASFPSAAGALTFLSVQMAQKIIGESVQLASINFIDRPINLAFIDSVLESVNAFLRGLIGEGAIIDGECSFDPQKNPPAQIADGKIVFDLVFMPPTPAEQIVFQKFIDINLLQSLIEA